MTATDEVFISDLLATRHPSLYVDLRGKLETIGITLREILGRATYGAACPCRSAKAGSCSSGTRRGTLLMRRSWSRRRRSRRDFWDSLVVDGGNDVRRGRVAVLTERVFAENPSWGLQEVERELRQALEIERLVVIPVEPGDALGHTDGVRHLVDEHTALVNDYAKFDRGYGEALRAVLREHGIEAVPIPYAPDLKSRRRMPPAIGVYVNLLEAGEAAFVPTHESAADEQALETIQSALGRPVVAIDSRSVAREGGALRCATWQLA